MSMSNAFLVIKRTASQLFAGKTGDSRDTPTSIPRNPPLEPIPKNILAFRTITHLLSAIQQNREFQATAPSAQPDVNQRQELKLTNAFSTVAVIEREIVAVVTKRASAKLEVVATIQPSDVGNPPTPSVPPSNYKKTILDFIFTQNPRRDDAVSATSQTGPTITDAMSLADFDLDDDEAIKKYAEECW